MLIEITIEPSAKIQKLLKTTLAYISNPILTKSKNYFVNLNSEPSKLYGLMKTQKENIPIHPVVSYVNSLTNKLEKKTQYHSQNSNELQPKLNN